MNRLVRTLTRAHTRRAHFWLREEYKSFEKRTAITPAAAKTLMARGHEVTVERFPERAIPDADYESAGCRIVDGGAWRKASKDVFVVGLKELPASDAVFEHKHIFFAHCYKYQDGWQTWLEKFSRGGGTIYDLEFLTYPDGRRVAAFGRSAGFVGAAVGLMAWANQKAFANAMLKGPLPYYENYDALVADVRERLAAVPGGQTPSMHVIGARGRCGSGATELAERSGLTDIKKWGQADTARGGPFPELLESDVIVNAILLDADNPPPPFVVPDMLNSADRVATVLADVSADGTNPTNPMPLYEDETTFAVPVTRVFETEGSPSNTPFDVTAIDQLPSLVPSESSEEFCEALLPHLLSLADGQMDVWDRAEELFIKKKQEAGV